ncbi:MAG: hypothetical protein DRJ97_01135 [Thermoprotei archaeon]|nr:MAG: hypothetical protein DRJ97_01135 [Thermoprotei archaeon]
MGDAEEARASKDVWLRSISVRLPDNYLAALDLLVERGLFRDRSEAIRRALKDLLRSVKASLS